MTSRRMRLGLAAVAVSAFALRAAPMLVANGALGTADYDEGVYVGAAGLVARGLAPYRDFVILHPPGIMVLLAPFMAVGRQVVGYADTFVALKLLACVVGAANAFAVGVLAHRWRGPVAALVAAVLYATFGPAVATEGRVMLEPFVTLACAMGALTWLAPGSALRQGRHVMAVGVALGAATSIKLYAGVFVVAVLAGGLGRWRPRIGVAAVAGATFLAVSLPFAVRAGAGRMFSAVVLTQLSRPGGDVLGGDVQGTWARAGHLLGYGPLSGYRLAPAMGALLLALAVAAAVWAWLAGGASGRFWAAAWVLTAATVLVAPSYFEQYASFAALPTSVLAGAAAAALLERFPVSPRVAGAVTAAVLLVVSAVAVRRALVNHVLDQPALPDFGATARAALPAGSCLYADPPTLSLAANRLPPRPSRGRVLLDPFGEPMWLAQQAGHRYASPQAARMAPAAQERYRQALDACPYVAVRGQPAGQVEWSAETRSWFERRFEPVVSPTGDGPGLWRLRPSA